MQKSGKILILLVTAVLFWFAAAFLYGPLMIFALLAFFTAATLMLWAARGLPLRGWIGIGLFFFGDFLLKRAFDPNSR